MLQYLTVIAESWPLTLMVVGIAIAIVVNRRLKQMQDDSQTLRDIRASKSVVVRDRYSDEG